MAVIPAIPLNKVLILLLHQINKLILIIHKPVKLVLIVTMLELSLIPVLMMLKQVLVLTQVLMLLQVLMLTQVLMLLYLLQIHRVLKVLMTQLLLNNLNLTLHFLTLIGGLLWSVMHQVSLLILLHQAIYLKKRHLL